jgi:hypothetical protein
MPDPGYDLSNEQDREDRRKHLDLLTGVINRQSAASARAKGWAITLASALYGVAAVRETWALTLLGVVILVSFCLLDSLYLKNEKQFRDLFDAVAENRVPPFSMDFASVSKRDRTNESYLSWSVTVFYGPLVAAGLLLGTFGFCLDVCSR